MKNLFLFFLMVAASEARVVKISLLHTTDLHGTIYPRDDYDGNEHVGGLLKIATLVERERARNPNALLVDCGDFIQGSPETFLTKGRVTIKAMDFLNYDAVVLGNHELDWGLDYTKKLAADFKAPLLAGNAVVRAGQHPLPNLKPFVIKDIDGVRVAIIGVTTPGMPLWFRPDTLQNLEFEDAVDTLRRIMPAVRDTRPDVIVLATHMGYKPFPMAREAIVNQVREVMRDFPEIDVICGGHSHRVIAEQRVRNTVYTQAGYFGIRLGRVDIEFDTVKDEIIAIRGAMVKADESVPAHEGLRTELADDLKGIRKILAQEIGVTAIDLHPHPDKEGRSPVQRILAGAIAREAKADFVLHGSLNHDFTLESGLIHERDIWALVPYENRIGVALLTTPEIRTILEENAARIGRGSFMGFWGGTYALDPKAPVGERVGTIRLPNGKPAHGRKRYRVAFNSHTLASAGGRFPELRRIVDEPIARLEMLDSQTRDIVRRWFKEKKLVEAEDLP